MSGPNSSKSPGVTSFTSGFEANTSATANPEKVPRFDVPKKPIARKLLKEVSPHVAAAYAGTGDKTLSRDVNALREMGLMTRLPDGYMAARHNILAFLPPMGSAPITG